MGYLASFSSLSLPKSLSGPPAIYTAVALAAASSAYLYSTAIKSSSMTRNLGNKSGEAGDEAENVVIVGASSGVGLELALLYAQGSNRARTASIHLVARRPLHDLEKRCLAEGAASVGSTSADASTPEGTLKLYEDLKSKWNRVDTVIICVGALTVLPILHLSGQATTTSQPSQLNSNIEPNLASLQRISSTALASYNANVTPCLLLTTALLPLLNQSLAPRIAVLSSVAAEIPAPTRTIYAANKAATSMLMRSLRIELEGLLPFESDPITNVANRKKIGITIVHPASIDTGLRSTALDIQGSFSSEGGFSKERKAMSPAYVAQRVVQAIEREQDEVWLPKGYWWISKIAMLLIPGVIKKQAKKKYGYT